uniref:Uncharacterized protein n=1 Tax=Romanomermis culicivorax TaxID=13658 RepID=A0A915KE80_ROMCU
AISPRYKCVYSNPSLNSRLKGLNIPSCKSPETIRDPRTEKHRQKYLENIAFFENRIDQQPDRKKISISRSNECDNQTNIDNFPVPNHRKSISTAEQVISSEEKVELEDQNIENDSQIHLSSQKEHCSQNSTSKPIPAKRLNRQRRSLLHLDMEKHEHHESIPVDHPSSMSCITVEENNKLPSVENKDFNVKLTRELGEESSVGIILSGNIEDGNNDIVVSDVTVLFYIFRRISAKPYVTQY